MRRNPANFNERILFIIPHFFSFFFKIPLPMRFFFSIIVRVLSDYGWLAQLVEQLTLNQRVAGSTPASSTKYQTERQGIANTKASDKAKRFWKRKWNLTNFETATFDFCKDIAKRRPKNFGWLAQLVEQLTLNQRVAGSTPASSTKHHLIEVVFFFIPKTQRTNLRMSPPRLTLNARPCNAR